MNVRTIIYHPHAELHHTKIEVMGLAVLPVRLKKEPADLAEAILNGTKLSDELAEHAAWVAKEICVHSGEHFRRFIDFVNGSQG